jgi:heat shock protein HslJ
VSVQEAGEAATLAPAGRFIAEFGPDADLFIQADCNVCTAGYEATDDGTVRVEGPIPCTLAWCESAPLDTRFLALMETADSWSVTDGALELSSTDGTLRFQSGG